MDRLPFSTHGLDVMFVIELNTIAMRKFENESLERRSLLKFPIKGGVGQFTVSRVLLVGHASDRREIEIDKVSVLSLTGISLHTIDEDISFHPDVNLCCSIALLIAVGARKKHGTSGEEIYASAYGVGLLLFRYPSNIHLLCEHDGTKDVDHPLELAICTCLNRASDVECTSNLVWIDVNNQPVYAIHLDETLPDLSDVLTLIASGIGFLPGDLLLVGQTAVPIAVKHGDILRGGVEGVASFRLKIGADQN
ncbi:hypothetical protein L0U95_32495 (plasmid) [Burkholderia cenocepacia]|uniref:hypothetical protein n=1 Tax=Burkholderia cenocepacia TaxID=95486 RepID=UPI001F221EF5|nr:hypothetical protein [Burkholderia cenocepacia]UJH78481.1 hypothetical protein L0U95_32495 [Burkholderia cenocepacia]